MTRAFCGLLLLCSVLLLHEARSAPLLEEGFGYSLGNLQFPWSNPGGSIQVTTNSLLYSGLADVLNGTNKVTITGGASRTQSRTFTSNPITSGVLYCGFIIQCASLPTASQYVIGVVSNTASGVTGSADPLLLYIQNSGSGYQFRIRTTGAAAVTAAKVCNVNEVHFVVLKYTFAGTGEADLYIDPSPLGTEPASPDATASGTSLPVNLAEVSMKAQSAASQGSWNLDTLRIGTSWSDVTPAPVTCISAAVTSPPMNQTVTEGETASFTISANGSSPTFQWQVSTNGGTTWDNVSGGTGANALTYTTDPLTTLENNNMYHCVVSVACGGGSTATSAAATLTVNACTTAGITADPVSQSEPEGATAIFSVGANGSSAQYQWQLSYDGLNWYNLFSASSATPSYTTWVLSTNDSGERYRCIVTVPCDGSTAISAAATLTVTPVINIPGVPELPVINTNNIFNAANYGAVGDGVTINTLALSNAINAAAAASGGGTVEIPAAAGTYLSGPLTMKSSVNLQIDSGATLQMLPYAGWPATIPFISGTGLHDVEISGDGTLDGQGSDWWFAFWSSNISRPNFIQFGTTTRILIQNVTLQNPPASHLMLKNNNQHITIQGIDIDTAPYSPNTDGMDLGSTNMLIQNCHISDGDDNIEIGGSSALAAYITITNCLFGHGHGVSVGSSVQAGVSNVTVINCVFTNTDYGIRMKSDSDRGGVVQNLSYYNLGMTNIGYAPILIYSYYNTYGAPTVSGITPSVAASQIISPVRSTTPIWQNIVISNLTATASQPGMIWARTEMPASNIVLSGLNISAPGTFQLYNVRGVQLADSQLSSGSYSLFNSEVTFTNSVPGPNSIALNGVSVTNGLTFYNQTATLADPTMFDATSISLGGGTLTDGTDLTLPGTTPVNFTLGTGPATLYVMGGLTLNSTLNILPGPGFGAGAYTLFSYTGPFSGTPVLGSKPAGFNYALLNSGGQLTLVVTSNNAIVPPFSIKSLQFLAPDAVALSWTAIPGQVYQVQSLDDLGQSTWAVQGTVTNSSNLGWFTNFGVSSFPQRFYRLMALP
jgi:hypothetical protein